MITALCIVGYILIGICVARYDYNLGQMESIKEMQKSLVKSQDNMVRLPSSKANYYQLRPMTEEELFEEAYKRVKKKGSSVGFSIISMIFWPASLLGLFLVLVFTRLSKLIKKLLPPSKADKKMQQIEQKRISKIEWETNLKILENAGLDTTEMRKMKIE